MKHTLILNCTDTKLHDRSTAYEMYSGSVLEMCKSKKVDQVKLFETFNVFFLSAKLGLISAQTVIERYDTPMAKSKSAKEEYAKEHKRQANKLLKQCAGNGAELFIALSKSYEEAFELMNLSAVKLFAGVYSTKNPVGVGVTRGKLGKILKSKMTGQSAPIIFRSGCTSSVEFLGYRTASQPVGTSLAYIGQSTKTKQYLLDCLKENHPVFLDNGIITAVGKGQEINTDEIMQSYIELVSPLKSAKSLDVVIPDSPFCQNNALAIVQRYKPQIQQLSAKCNVIIVFHKPVQRSVKEQLVMVSAILGKDTNFIVGIPTRTNINGESWRLDIGDIESLFRVKKSNGQQAVTKAHFLGISEASRGKAFHERLSLCQMYGVEFRADACRTTALFGHNETSNRKGSRLSRAITEEKQLDNARNSTRFQGYELNDEWDEPMVCDALNSRCLEERWEIMNAVLPFELEPLENFDKEGEDPEEYFDDVTSGVLHYQGVFEQLKAYFLKEVFVRNKHKPGFSEVRAEAITQCFLRKGEDRNSVQMALGC